MTEPVESIVTGIDWGASDKDESVYCEVRLDEKTGIMTIVAFGNLIDGDAAK